MFKMTLSTYYQCTANPNPNPFPNDQNKSEMTQSPTKQKNNCKNNCTHFSFSFSSLSLACCTRDHWATQWGTNRKHLDRKPRSTSHCPFPLTSKQKQGENP